MPEELSTGLPEELHIGNAAIAVAHKMKVKGCVIVTDNGDGTISFCGHGLNHAKTNELLSVAIHINLTQHDKMVAQGAAGSAAQAIEQAIQASREVPQ